MKALSKRSDVLRLRLDRDLDRDETETKLKKDFLLRPANFRKNFALNEKVALEGKGFNPNACALRQPPRAREGRPWLTLLP